MLQRATGKRIWHSKCKLRWLKPGLSKASWSKACVHACLTKVQPTKWKGREGHWQPNWEFVRNLSPPFSQCLKITEKVSLVIASEASNVYILSQQKFIKNAKNSLFGNLLKILILRSNSVTRQIGGKCQKNVWKSLKIVAFELFNFGISTNFCPSKNDLSGNTVWSQDSGFQKPTRMDLFGHF